MTATTRKRETKSLRPQESVANLLAGAEKILADVEHAQVMSNHSKREYPTFEAAEVQIGEVLGVGGFGVVSEVSSLVLPPQQETAGAFHKTGSTFKDDEDPDQDNEDHYELGTAKEKMVRRCMRYGQARYAIKKLDPMLNEMDRTRGMIDMALEVKYLMVLWHPNIVKMRGVCSGEMMSRNAFFVMDRLYETLDTRIKTWAKQKRGTSSMFGFKKDQVARRLLQVERLLVAYDLAMAFAYMHENQLVYRDIKQENFGFDIRGDIKVFDFGLTKALLPSLKEKKSKMYNLTPITGSLPYMAPEVALKNPYDTRCDCFSFALLMHEILVLRNTPYHGYSPREYLQRVIKSNERPPIRRTWPKRCQQAIKTSWDTDPQKRPLMKDIAKMIREDLNWLSEEDSVLNRTNHMVDKSSRSMVFTVADR